MENIIQIARSKYIEESRAIAELRLRYRAFRKGELVMLNYYKDQDVRTNIGVLVAIGIGDGTGEQYFRVLHGGGSVTVRRVGYLPDVSRLVHGEVYVWYGDPDLRDNIDEYHWNYVYTHDNINRIIEPITGGPYIFYDLESGYRWFYSDQTCKREDDFLTASEINQLIQEVLNVNTSVSITSLSGNLFETGSTETVDLQVLVTNGAGENIRNKCKFFIGDEEIHLDSNGIYALEDISTTQDITITVKYPLSENIWASSSGTVHLEFGYPFYYGRVSSNWTPSSQNIIELENEKLWYKGNFKWPEINLKNQTIAFSYPKSYGNLEHIFDVHGLDYISDYYFYDNGYQVDGVPYVVYLKKDVVDVSEFDQLYSFLKSLSIEDFVADGTLLELSTAWQNKNTSGGVVILGQDGKIPNLLYNQEASAAFTDIVEIVTEYPESGMLRGEIYYNITTNKLYKATSSTDGVISDPIVGYIYTCGNDFYSLDGNKLVKFSRLTTQRIQNLTEILR